MPLAWLFRSPFVFGEDAVGIAKEAAVGLRAEAFKVGVLSAMLSEFHCVVLEGCRESEPSRHTSFWIERGGTDILCDSSNDSFK